MYAHLHAHIFMHIHTYVYLCTHTYKFGGRLQTEGKAAGVIAYIIPPCSSIPCKYLSAGWTGSRQKAFFTSILAKSVLWPSLIIPLMALSMVTYCREHKCFCIPSFTHLHCDPSTPRMRQVYNEPSFPSLALRDDRKMACVDLWECVEGKDLQHD